jgi:hypothetical protein
MVAPLKQKRKPGKNGRPKYTPKESERRQVKTMIGFGLPLQDVASCLLIDPRTLKKYYPKEIETGKAYAITSVANALYKNAIGTPLEVKDGEGKVIERHERAGNVVAQIFFLKCRGGGLWVDKEVRELTGPNGQPLNATPAKVVFALPPNGRESRPKLSEGEREEFEREIEARERIKDEAGNPKD